MQLCYSYVSHLKDSCYFSVITKYVLNYLAVQNRPQRALINQPDIGAGNIIYSLQAVSQT